MAIAVASLAMLATISPERDVQSIKLAWGSVGPRVMMLPEVEAYLTGRPLTIEALRGAGRLASAGVAPIDDVRAKAEYRRQLAGNLLVRLLGTDQNNWR